MSVNINGRAKTLKNALTGVNINETCDMININVKVNNNAIMVTKNLEFKNDFNLLSLCMWIPSFLVYYTIAYELIN